MFSFFSKREWLLLGGCSLVFAGAFFYFYQPQSKEESKVEIGEQLEIEEKISVKEESKIEKPVEQVMIDIKGEVLNPGVYSMKSNERVKDAIEKAGGMTSEASVIHVNLAELLHDAMVIYIPNQQEDNERKFEENQAEHTKEKILLNQATSGELEKVPGIGPAKATAIIQYREENGKFTSVEELTNVPGIGAKTLENIQDYFIVK